MFMKKTIICLSGPANSGKTTSVRKLYEFLGGTDKTHAPEVVDSVKYKGFTIGCMSIGDPNSSQEENLDKLLKEGCDIVVTACRSYGGTVEVMESLAKDYEYRVIRFSHVYIYPNTENVGEAGETLYTISHEINMRFALTIIDKLIAGESL